MKTITASAFQREQLNAINEKLRPHRFYLSDDTFEDVQDELECWNWDGRSVLSIIDFADNNGISANWMIGEYFSDGWPETVPEEYVNLSGSGKTCFMILAIDADGIALTATIMADSDGIEQVNYQIMRKEDALKTHAINTGAQNDN